VSTATDDAGDGAAEGDPGAATEPPTGREVDRRPTPLSALVAVAASAITAIAAGVGSLAGGAVAGLGVAVVAPAVIVGRRWAVDLGGLGLLGGVALGGAGDVSELWVLTAAVAAVVAWDAGGNAISLGEQLGRDADTASAELAHVGATVAVGTTTGGVAYVLYLLAGGQQPLSAVLLLLVAVLVLVSFLR